MAYPIPEREGRAGEDPCGCFAKAFLGIDDVVVGTGIGIGTAMTGDFATKPRTGAAGGGNAGNRTSWWSQRVHEHNVKHGKTARSRAARKMGRKVITKFIPGVGLVLFVFDSAVYADCIAKCESCE